MRTLVDTEFASGQLISRAAAVTLLVDFLLERATAADLQEAQAADRSTGGRPDRTGSRHQRDGTAPRACTACQGTRRHRRVPAHRSRVSRKGDGLRFRRTPGDGGRPCFALEGWWFVVGGEPGLALSFFFGDEFGSFASFGVDAVAAVLFAGLLASRHHRRAVRARAAVEGGQSAAHRWTAPAAGNSAAPWASVA